MQYEIDDTGTEIRHPGFRDRLTRAIEWNRNGVPQKGAGAHRHIAERMTALGILTRPQTVSQWNKGYTTPGGPTKGRALAQVLGVDYNWLMEGIGGEYPTFADGSAAPSSERLVPLRPSAKPTPIHRPDTQGMAIGLATAMVTLAGATNVRTTPGGGPVHFQFTAPGNMVVPVHAVLGERIDDGWSVTVPPEAVEATVLGILPVSPTSFKMVELFWDDLVQVAEKDEDGNLTITITDELTTGGVAWKPVEGFGRRRLLR